MATPMLVWSGPDSAAADKLDVPTGTLIAKLPCIGTGGCQQVVAAGLSAALANAGVADPGGALYMAGFSAGHGANDSLFGSEEVAGRARAYLSFDSYYAGATPPGILSVAQRAAAGEVVMISTTSNPAGASWRTCEQAIQPLLAQLDLQQVGMPAALAGLKPATRVLNRGLYWHFAFEGTYVHGDHANVIAPAISRWVFEELLPASEGAVQDAGAKGVAAVFAAVGAFFAAKWWWRRRRP